MYYCNNCDTEIDDDNVAFNRETGTDECPHCKSQDVDYFPCEISEDAEQPGDAEAHQWPDGYGDGGISD